MLFSSHVYGDTCNSECHYHDCEGDGVDVHGCSFRTYLSAHNIECVASIKRSLRPPMQASEVRILSLLCWPVELGGLPLDPARFFFALFLLT